MYTYTILMSTMGGDEDITDEELEAVNKALPDHIGARRPRAGECEGTYRDKADGTLQILGYSIPMDEEVELEINAAFDRALDILNSGDAR